MTTDNEIAKVEKTMKDLIAWVEEKPLDNDGRFFGIDGYTGDRPGRIIYNVTLYDVYQHPQVGGPRPTFIGRADDLNEAITDALLEARRP